MADQLVGLIFVFERVDGDVGIGFNRPSEVVMLAIYSGRDCLFGEACRDIGGDFGGGYACGVVA